jgi:3-oxoadipate enol-lactonase
LPPTDLDSPRPAVLVRPDADIHYWTAGGAPEAPTVICLHGATLDHHAWAPQAHTLVKEHYRFVAPDLRGHGTSTGHFNFASAVEDTLALLDVLQVERVVLVGLSLGGNIAQEVIRRAPHQVIALVAADTTCNTVERHPLAATATVAALQTQAMINGPEFARQAANAISTKPHVQRYALEANAHRSNREIVDILTALLTTALRPDPTYRLPIPSLLVHGAHDHIGDIATSTRGWAHREPLGRYAVVPDAGHASNLDNPAAFDALLLPFLAELTIRDRPVEDRSGPRD